MRVITTMALCAAFVTATATFAAAQDKMSAEQCSAWLKKADGNGDGSLGQGEAEPFLEKLKGMDVKPRDANIISKDEFMQWCEGGSFAGMQM